jgi:formamidopyrimidine-DNA glycosylase
VPEYPDVTVYIERLEAKVTGHVLEGLRITSPFVVRTYDPPISAINGLTVRGFRRIGKRIVFAFDDDLFLILHLMVAGRIRWRAPGAKLNRRLALAGFDFAHGTLLLTEASKKKRASLHLVRGEAALADHDRGGIELFGLDREGFKAVLLKENHTLKRTLTDPRLFSGIGNAYSDEILHRAQLSPLIWSTRLKEEQITRLYEATLACLTEWTQLLRDEVGDGFPDKVTAFRKEMAVHGRYKEPCPVCGDPVQRIVYADNQTNYCATCQTGGKLLADRVLSRLMKDDWPKTLEELEGRKSGQV